MYNRTKTTTKGKNKKMASVSVTSVPPLGILICTYNRPAEIRQVIWSLQQYMPYENTVWCICDDSSGGSYLTDLANDFAHLPNFNCISTPRNSGWGANVNMGLAWLQDHGVDHVYFTEDDYVLTDTIDPRPIIALLDVHPGIGMVRVDGIAGHRLVAHMAETVITGHVFGDYCQSVGDPGRLHYWLIDQASPSLNIYSNRPHFKRISIFHKYYGYYRVGAKLGETEDAFAHRVRDNMRHPGAPAIAALPEHVIRKFDDIGVSYQHTPLDKEHTPS